MLKFVCVCEAGQYLVSRCAHSQRGGVSIWQVRPLRVCVCMCVCVYVCVCVSERETR